MVRCVALVFVSLTLAAINFERAAFADDVAFSQSTCSTKCKNPCSTFNMVCCFCDNSVNFWSETCSCCPNGYSCCNTSLFTKYRGSSCCPPLSTCNADGSCTYDRAPQSIPAMSYCGPRCRQDTQLNVTGDDVLTSVYFDGNLQQFTQNMSNWRVTKTCNLSGLVSVIAISAENTDRAGGILCSTSDGSIVSDRTWKCTDVYQPDTKWTTAVFDDSKWQPPCVSDPNIMGQPRNQYMSTMSNNSYWIWSICGDGANKGFKNNWAKYCYCRLTLPSMIGV
jgi:hypothetical protein